MEAAGASSSHRGSHSQRLGVAGGGGVGLMAMVGEEDSDHKDSQPAEEEEDDDDASLISRASGDFKVVSGTAVDVPTGLHFTRQGFHALCFAVEVFLFVWRL